MASVSAQQLEQSATPLVTVQQEVADEQVADAIEKKDAQSARCKKTRKPAIALALLAAADRLSIALLLSSQNVHISKWA